MNDPIRALIIEIAKSWPSHALFDLESKSNEEILIIIRETRDIEKTYKTLSTVGQ